MGGSIDDACPYNRIAPSQNCTIAIRDKIGANVMQVLMVIYSL